MTERLNKTNNIRIKKKNKQNKQKEITAKSKFLDLTCIN